MAAPVPPWADVITTEVLLATSPEIAKTAMSALEDRLLWTSYEPVHDKNAYFRAILRNKEDAYFGATVRDKEEKMQARRMLDFDTLTGDLRIKQDGGHDEMMNCNGDNENGEHLEEQPPCGERGAGCTSQALGLEENEEVKTGPDHNHRVPTPPTPQARGPNQQRKWVDLALTVSKVHTLLNSPRRPSVSMHADLPADMSIEDQLLLHHCLDELTFGWGEISRQEKCCLHERIICAGTSIS